MNYRCYSDSADIRWVWFGWGIPDGRVDEALARFGLQAERTLTGEEGRAVYMKRSDGTLHDSPYGFGVLVHALPS